MSSSINKPTKHLTSSSSGGADKARKPPKKGKFSGHSVTVQNKDAVSETKQHEKITTLEESGESKFSSEKLKEKLVKKRGEKSDKISSIAKRKKITRSVGEKEKLDPQRRGKKKISGSSSSSRRSRNLGTQPPDRQLPYLTGGSIGSFNKTFSEIKLFLKLHSIEINEKDIRNPAKLIKCTHDLELSLVRKTNTLLCSVRKGKKRGLFLREALNHIEAIKTLNIKLLRLPFSFFLRGASSEIKDIARTFNQAKENPEDLIKNPKKFIGKAEKFTIISLIKLHHLKSGKSFLKALASTLCLNKHYIDIKSIYTINSCSLRVAVAGHPMDGFIENIQSQEGKSAAPPQIEILSRNLFKTHKARKGTSSSLQFSITLKEEADPIEYSKTLAKNPKKLELAIGHMISGNFSFTKDLRLIYTPAFIEIAHELVHALHSSLGVNAQMVPLRDEDQEVWTNPEEFRAIQGIPSENFFAKDIGLPERFSHHGLQYRNVVLQGLKIIDKKEKELRIALENLKKEKKHTKDEEVEIKSKKGYDG